jgi:1-acyl-sn-glycerol-3-phosphate acyltransferase
VILASNHLSFLDPPLVGSPVARMCRFLARSTLFKNRLFGRYLLSLGVVPVDRDGGGPAGLKTALRLLEEGQALVLFPEGTRSADGRLQPARPGIGLIAIKSGAPVVPVRVFGTYEAWGRHRRWPRFCRLALSYGPPLRFEREQAKVRVGPHEEQRDIYQGVAKEIMAAIAALEPPP